MKPNQWLQVRRGGSASIMVIACACAALARPAHAGVVSVQELLGHAGTAVDVMMAEAEYDAAQADWDRARSEQGWKLSVGAGYGTERDLVDETRTRNFEAIRTQVTLAYPLLGSRAKGDRDVEEASGKVAEARIRRDTALRIAELHVEDVYAALWGAQESLEVTEAYLLLAQRRDPSTDDPADGYTRARQDLRRLTNRREQARERLQQLTGQPLGDLIVTSVQLPKIPPIDVKRLEQDHPELAVLRAQHTSARTQLDGSVWYGIDAAFDITQSTIQDRSDGQAGNGLFANFNVQIPLTFYQAGLSERRKLRAEMQYLDLKIKDKREGIVLKARAAEAEHVDLYDEVETAAERARAGIARLRDAGRPSAALLRDYYTRAMAEIDARTRYWRSHINLRSYVPVGAAEPAPEPTGPSISDVGSRLAEPLLKAARGG